MTTYCDLMDLPTDQCSHCVVEVSRGDQVAALARTLMHHHGLRGWTFKFDNAKTRFGRCCHSTRTISLSKHWAEARSVELSRITILHEIAHALVGPGAGHGPVWVAKARELGIAGDRCSSAGGARLERAAQGVCPAGHRTEAHKLPRRVKSCSRCCPGAFNPSFIFTWTLNGKPATMGPQYRQELALIRAEVVATA